MKELITFLEKYDQKFDVVNGRIVATVINLSWKKIKTLPESFGNITAEDIYLSYNELKTLPESIGNIRAKSIYLSYNQIETLPESFCNIKAREISLRGNKIKTLPEKFGNIIASHIFLDNNQIEPSWIYKKFKENVIEEDYIFCDGILTHLQGKKKVGKYTVYVGYFDFVATMDNKTFAHGTTIESAISDLRFKLSDRNTKVYIFKN